MPFGWLNRVSCLWNFSWVILIWNLQRHYSKHAGAVRAAELIAREALHDARVAFLHVLDEEVRIWEEIRIIFV